MYPEAYKEWIGIFNDNLSETWQKERKELQKAAMLLTALQKELNDVQTNLEVQLINLQQKLKFKDDLEEKRKSLPPENRKKEMPKSVNNEKELPDSETTFVHPLEEAFIETQKESPDLFKNINQNIEPSADTSVIDLSISDEDAQGDGSPTIKRRRRYYHRNKIAINIKSRKAENTPKNKVIAENSLKTNLFKTPLLKQSDDDLSVIENTPEVCHKSNIGGVTLNKTGKNISRASNTLTQMFGRARKKLQMNIDKKTEDDIDSDETYFEETTDGTKLGITDMINYINEDGTMMNQEKSSRDQRIDNDLTEYDENLDSSQEVDQFSKGAIFNDTEVATSNEKPKLIPLEAEPIVRGKARKQLQGWSCERCKNFYEHMKLSPEELKKKMDECSRHRYKYRPIEETLPGFWDLTIPPEEPD